MRNLKKILALVLALVMSMSVMSVASADFKDSDKVNGKFATAVEVLNGLRVFKGYEDGTFNPTGAITRAEVAAIIYRIDTGDVDGKQVQIYADYNKFNDVKSTAWYAGYVNYCANALYIRGYDEHTFGPNDKVTGYQALAMILRVIGYDKNGEFSGSAWQIETAKYAQRLGLTKNVDVNTLGVAATRELVAELLFRAITEEKAFQVDYNLLRGYYQVGNTIGEDRFELVGYRTTDAWGRPATAWDAKLYNKVQTIVEVADAPLAVYTEAVDQCTIRKDTGVYGNIDKFYVNGVKGATYINGQHHVENDFLAQSEQGTVVEVYADKTIVVIDTYLSYVSSITTPAYDKNGHQYRWAKDTFTLFNAPVDTASVDGNNFTKGDFWLVNYNEEYEFVAPYAVPSTLDAKQTYIWWNAEKHTIDGTVYMDNANYGAEMDDAGYDKDSAYTWFFDTYGNVIGSMDIYVAAPEAQYAVVLGAQWVNAIGKPGYAAATLQYMNGEIVEGAVISKVEGNPARYGGTIPTAVSGKNFVDGYFYTTYQYNLNTMADLYMVKETDAGLELTSVDTIGNVNIYDGVSRIETTNVYTDNNTVFAFYNAKTGVVDFVVGYDNLTSGVRYECENVDYVVNPYTGFAQFVYIPAHAVKSLAGSDFEYKYVYITGDAMNYKLKDQFALLGVVDVAGNTDPLAFSMSYAGNEAATEAALNEIVELYQDMLCHVVLENGKVVAIAPVALDGINAPIYLEGNAEYFAADEVHFTSTGAIIVLDGTGRAFNVNHNTVIINEGKVGSAINNMDYIYGNNIYVVYAGSTAMAIFVTPTSNTAVIGGVEMTLADAMVKTLTADDFSDVTYSFTYDIAADAEAKAAAIKEAVVNGTALTLIEGLSTVANEITVTVDSIEALTDDGLVNLATVTIATATATKTVEIVIFFEVVEDAE